MLESEEWPRVCQGWRTWLLPSGVPMFDDGCNLYTIKNGAARSLSDIKRCYSSEGADGFITSTFKRSL